MVQYSVVIPLKNEEENVQELLAELEEVMLTLKEAWEVIFVDDGSEDRTLQILKKLKEGKGYIRILSFDKNYGQTSAFDAGFKAAKGNFIITLDGDLQNDPRDIPKLLNLIPSYDLVAGFREKRQDPISKRWISKLANAIRRMLCKDHAQDTGCSLKVYRKSALEKIPLFHGMHRFFPALFLNHGFKVTETAVHHRPRKKGVTKYNFFNRSFNTIADMLAVRWMRLRTLKYKVSQEW